MPGFIIKYLASIFGILCWLIPGYAQSAQAPTHPENKQIVAVFPEYFPPIFNITVNNTPTGFGVEVIDDAAARAGLKVKYVPVPTWQEALNLLQKGEADIIPNLGITAERKKMALFTRPVNLMPVSLMVFHDTGKFSTLAELRNSGYSVGVVKTNIGNTLLENEPAIKKRVYQHLVDALADMANKNIDAMIYPVSVAKDLARSLRLQGNLKVVGNPLLEIPRAIAVNMKKPELREKLDHALAGLLASGSYQKIYDRWHPKPVFWNHERIAYLVSLFIFLMLSIYVYFRFNVLRKVNNQLHDSNVFVKTILDNSAEGVLTLDKQGQIHSVNKAAEILFDRSAQELIGNSIRELMPENEGRAFVKLLNPATIQHSGANVHPEDHFREYRIRNNNGKFFPVRMALNYTLLNTQWLFICTIQDVSALREAESLAEFYSTHDLLTGLINQNGFSILLNSLIAQSERHERNFAVLHIEIDRMTAINNNYGHKAGDQVLLHFSRRIENIIRESDFIGAYDNALVRVSGTRFMIMLPETSMQGAEKAARRIIAEVELQPLQVNSQNIHVSCKIGIANFPEHGKTEVELLTRSETALRIAKMGSSTPYHIYNINEDDIERNTSVWTERILEGLREDRFILLFQPILDIKSGTVHHFEALVRYIDDNNNLVTPNEFVPVAEKYGLIKLLDRRIMQLAISHLAGLEAAGKDISIGINLSGANIGDPEIFDWLETLFEENELNPDHIVFEITETASLHSITAARTFIDSIKALGCRIALDDFGTGLSSFSYLRNFPVDILKIDGSFVTSLPTSHEDRVMVRSMIDVAHSLGKQVVAEFVSSEEIFNILCEFGVDYAQGYHISKPVKLEDYL